MNYFKGYKAFHRGMINNYGEKFSVGQSYYRTTEYNFCKNLEDTLVYYRNSDDIVCEIISYGNIDEYYNSYYDISVYHSDNIYIKKVLTRNEMIDMFLNMSTMFENRIIRFISLYRLNNDEIKMFRDKFIKNYHIKCAIEYYQEGNIYVYKRRCNRNGQNNY